MDERTVLEIELPPGLDASLITGQHDRYLHLIQDLLESSVALRGNRLHLSGDANAVALAERLFTEIIARIQGGESLDEDSLRRLALLLSSSDLAPADLRRDVILTHRGKVIRPKTAGQKKFVDAIRSHPITFGLGPAGTGKTFLACAMAVSALKDKEVGRIVLTRPIVEAGESLGFLPGTIMEKVDPYIRPLYDALFDLMDVEKAVRLIEDGTIEITPLAFMRGRTFNDCYVILDEAQNTTPEQMKMFLTRLGFGTKMIITGDESQSDSPRGAEGIRSAKAHLSALDQIAFCQLKGTDVVRNSLVAEIVAAYEKPADPSGGEH